MNQQVNETAVEFTEGVVAAALEGAQAGLDYQEKGLDRTTRFTVKYTKGRARITAEGVEYEPEDIGWFYLSPMPGCCGVVVSHQSFLEPRYRGRLDISRDFRNLKDKVCKELGYKVVIMTTQMGNIPAVKNMFNRGFRVAHTFTNPRTNNLLSLGWKELS